MTRCAALLLAAPLAVCSAAASLRAEDAAASTDWPRWRGPDCSGISAEKGWRSDWSAAAPKTLWKASVGAGFSSLAVAGGRVYTMGNADDKDTVFALDAGTGGVVWRHDYACKLDPNLYEGGPSATPTVDGGFVYTLSKAGHVFCLESATGKVVWTRNVAEDPGAKPPKWGFAGSAFVDGKKLILNVGSAGLALDRETGKVLWTSGNGPAGYSTPVPCAMGGRRGVALFLEKSVTAVDPESGQILWQHPWKTNWEVNAADPIVAGNRVFISAGYGSGCALLQIEEGKAAVLWKNRAMRNHINSSVLWQDHVYGFDGDAGTDARLKCLELKTGEVKWAQEGLGSGSLMLADGKLIVMGAKGELVLAEASPAGFREIGRAQVLGGKCWTVPVLSGGRIYARNAKGDVVCVDLR